MGLKINPSQGTIQNEQGTSITIEDFSFPALDGTLNTFLRTDGAGTLTFEIPGVGLYLEKINSTYTGDYTLLNNFAGHVGVGASNLPANAVAPAGLIKTESSGGVENYLSIGTDLKFAGGTVWHDGNLNDPYQMTSFSTPSTLVAGDTNEITGAGTYTLPAANSVPVDYSLIVELSDKYASLIPIVQRAGTDTISDSVGTDVSVTLDSGSVRLRFISDGVSDWRI